MASARQRSQTAFALTPRRSTAEFKQRAAEVYAEYATQFKRRFKWLRPDLFVKSLAKDLADDAASLLDSPRNAAATGNPARTPKLDALLKLLTKQHPNEKVIVFTQFADTVRYLEAQLHARGVQRLAGVTGEAEDPTSYAWRFSPVSNNKRGQVQRRRTSCACWSPPMS